MTRSLLICLLLSSACKTSTAAGDSAAPAPAPDASAAAARAVVDAADRSPEDRAIDAGRHPAEMLAFLALKPGMNVGEIGAGAGYTTELLARAVAPNGVVYMENPPEWVAAFLGKMLPLRFEHAAMKNVVRGDRPFDDPFPPEAKNLDAVVFVATYHDVVNVKGADRAKLNRLVFEALKPGGAYVVIDNSAAAGSGTRDTDTLHRIDESVVRDEVAKAGFRLEGESQFLRNPADARDWNVSPRAAGPKRGTGDRFALKFVKPQG